MGYRTEGDMASPFASKIAPKDVEDAYPCTPFQEGFMATTQAKPGTYVTSHTYTQPDDIDMGRFKAAWQAVVQSCSPLRTRIVYNGNKGSLQVVMKNEMHWRPATSLEDANTREDAVKMAYGTPLSTFCLIVGPESPPTFVWTAHHAIYDG
jgi:hypothetical protein